MQSGDLILNISRLCNQKLIVFNTHDTITLSFVITATVASRKYPNFKSQNVFVVRVNGPLLVKNWFLFAMGSLEMV
jgi:hypothetical protein